MLSPILKIGFILSAFGSIFVSGFASPLPGKAKPKAYPFNQLVVYVHERMADTFQANPLMQRYSFGDQFSDDGNGSYAHGLDPNNIYNYFTWTDGPVVPQYLADLLNVPSLNHAWGGAFGGGLAGSTLDNDYTPAKDSYNGKPVPSTQEQIFDNYTANGAPDNIESALQFIWVRYPRHS